MKLIASHTIYNNANFKSLTDILVLANVQRTWADGVVTAEIKDLSLATIPTVLAWVSVGGEVEEMPAFIEFTPTAYAGNVPDTIPNYSYTDESEQEVIRTWSEWKDATHEHHEIDGKHYVPSNAFGVDLKGSELAIVHGLSGVSILTASDYKALLPNGEE